MELDDLLERKKHNYKIHGNYQHHDEDEYRFYYDRGHSPSHSNNTHFQPKGWLVVLNAIKENRKLRIAAIFGVILVLAVAVLVIILLFPVVMKLFDFISSNGLQGLLDEVSKVIDRIFPSKSGS